MDNQHRKIKGYRELNEDEIALMNAIKAEGEDIRQLLETVSNHLDRQADVGTSGQPVVYGSTPEFDRISNAEPRRWASIARTHFQEGLMALTRAVAQPESF